jgi:hypothetical protein
MGNYWLIISEVTELIDKLNTIYRVHIGSVYATDTELLYNMGVIKDQFISRNPKYINYIGFISIHIEAGNYETDDGETLWKFEDFDIVKTI